MINTYGTRRMVVLSLLLVAGCGDKGLPTSPSVLPSATQPAQPAPQPTQPARQVQPTVTGIAPSTGSTDGGAWGVITGMDFQPGATVAFGSGPALWTTFQSSTALAFGTRAHDAGRVDVVVTNPGGLGSTLSGGYTFAPPTSFDFNGDWIAHAGHEYEMDMRFTIRNHELVSLSCGGVPVTLQAPVGILGAEFSSGDTAGLRMTGKLVSPVNAVGTVDFAECSSGWWAAKSGD